MLRKSQKVQLNSRENRIGNQEQTFQRNRYHWVQDRE
jgi:hypothetical protein